MTIKNKTALVTGASRGIGKAIALALAKQGVNLILTARSTDSLNSTLAEAEKLGVKGKVFSCDFSKKSEVENLVSEVKIYSQVDILINNAGIAESYPLLKTSFEEWQRHFAVNVDSTFLLTQAFVSEMAERKWGRIVNVASTAGKIGYAYTAAYTASKHALLGLTKVSALEFAKKNVTVNAVCPSFVNTEIVSKSIKKINETTGMEENKARETLSKLSPQNRLLEAQEIADLTVFLCSEQAKGITGQGINIDGGTLTF